MKIIVQKYGGTSVATPDRLNHVANRIKQTKEKGYMVVVVVSAMGKTTDDLIQMAMQLNPAPPTREMDMLMSAGEQISSAALAMTLHAKGVNALSLTGGMSGIVTDLFHSRARIDSIEPTRVLDALQHNQVVIVAGFQGVTKNGDITTLGRGGSDTTAAALAIALKAECCEIYTDVDGVYTADPRMVKKASKLGVIDYDEMLELARLGASVLHPRSVELARVYGMPLVVKSSFSECEGTWIREVDTMEKVQIRGIALDDNIARLAVSNVPDRPGIAFDLFSRLAKEQIGIDMIIQNLKHGSYNDISFTVSREDVHTAQEVCHAFCEAVGGKSEVDKREDVVKLSVVGTGISGNADVASEFFGTLYELGINIDMISTSEIKISCLIDSEQGELALNALHDAFDLSRCVGTRRDG